MGKDYGDYVLPERKFVLRLKILLQELIILYVSLLIMFLDMLLRLKLIKKLRRNVIVGYLNLLESMVQCTYNQLIHLIQRKNGFNQDVIRLICWVLLTFMIFL